MFEFIHSKIYVKVKINAAFQIIPKIPLDNYLCAEKIKISKFKIDYDLLIVNGILK